MFYQKSSNLVIILVILIIIACSLECFDGVVEHRVGDSSLWSIPENKDFYYNWSINQSFHIGDTLVFEFQSEFHNVMQVSRREFDSCTAENPFQEFRVGPATIPLIQEGVYYFICSFVNYCSLGQKLSITVHPTTTSPLPPPPLPTSSPPPAPCDVDDDTCISQPPALVSHAVPSSVSLTSTRTSASVCSTRLVYGWGWILCAAVYTVSVF
ncbi:Plastocyanin-like [Macleaya cordata]|uniref:Plastocyanin-like n=1 Tax=Macleaya cordata TaxID=56857 RepID=A0A200R332_MACCD|nr:Plastocyanin-like [Macleaya cordata]